MRTINDLHSSVTYANSEHGQCRTTSMPVLPPQTKMLTGYNPQTAALGGLQDAMNNHASFQLQFHEHAHWIAFRHVELRFLPEDASSECWSSNGLSRCRIMIEKNTIKKFASLFWKYS
jgi:hypothetical protein